MIHCFEIPGRLPGTNDYTKANRTNRYVGAKMKRETQEVIEWAIKAARLSPITKQVDVHITFVEPNMKRDKDNIQGGTKFILDALVKMGILKNDGWNEIGDIAYHYIVNKSNPRVVVELEEL